MSEADAVSFAVTALEQGRVIGLPTDTVYGLAARASHPEAVEEIYRLKGRPRAKALPFLLAGTSDLATFVNEVPARAVRLARRFWPGPLTLVLGPGEGVALRVPDHPLALAVLGRVSGPVRCTSANRAGDPPALTAEDVRALFPELACVVDGGPAPLGRESTVASVDSSGRVQVLREGALRPEEIVAEVPFEILLVCTGNTCRSPMAQVVLQARLAEALEVLPAELPGRGLRIRSAGLAAAEGAPMAEEAQAALRARGLPGGEEHRTRSLRPEDLEEADLVLVMSEGHRTRLLGERPDLGPKIELLDPGERSLEDPYGGGFREYATCLERILEHVQARLGEVLRRVGTGPRPGEGSGLRARTKN